MHIPDGFLDAPTAATMGVLSLAGVGLALAQARRHLPPRRVPLLGLAGAFVFAAQMLNFPVAGGTSGHLVGAVLTAALLGPSAAVIVLTAVLLLQCLLFADGGVTALGANIFNMALIGGVGGWLIYYPLARLFPGAFGRILGAAFAAWVSTVVAAVACAGELAASHTVAWNVVFPAMAGIHMLIGLGEAIITALVLAGIARARPELLDLPAHRTSAAAPITRARREGTGALVAMGLLIGLGLALFVAPFACPWPDGLVKTAQVKGFADRESPRPGVPTPLADYRMPGLPTGLATSAAAVTGTVVAFGLAWGLAWGLTRKDRIAGQAGSACPTVSSRGSGERI